MKYSRFKLCDGFLSHVSLLYFSSIYSSKRAYFVGTSIFCWDENILLERAYFVETSIFCWNEHILSGRAYFVGIVVDIHASCTPPPHTYFFLPFSPTFSLLPPFSPSPNNVFFPSTYNLIRNLLTKKFKNSKRRKMHTTQRSQKSRVSQGI